MELETIKDPRYKKWKALEDRGVTRAKIARRNNTTRQTVTNVLGKKPPRPSGGKPRPSKHIYCQSLPFRDAQEVAASLGYRLVSGSNAGDGSVGLLVEAIGKGDVRVVSLATYERMEIACRMVGPTAIVDERVRQIEAAGQAWELKESTKLTGS